MYGFYAKVVSGSGRGKKLNILLQILYPSRKINCCLKSGSILLDVLLMDLVVMGCVILESDQPLEKVI